MQPLSDVLTKRVAKQKLGIVVRATKDIDEVREGTCGQGASFRSCGRGNYVIVEWLIPQAEAPLPFTEFSQWDYKYSLTELPKPVVDPEVW